MRHKIAEILNLTEDNIHPAVLASLPPSMQLDLLVQMRERLWLKTDRNIRKSNRGEVLRITNPVLLKNSSIQKRNRSGSKPCIWKRFWWCSNFQNCFRIT